MIFRSTNSLVVIHRIPFEWQEAIKSYYPIERGENPAVPKAIHRWYVGPYPLGDKFWGMLVTDRPVPFPKMSTVIELGKHQQRRFMEEATMIREVTEWFDRCAVEKQRASIRRELKLLNVNG